MKWHHPEVFCASLLNSQPMGFYQPAQLVRDAKEHGVEVRAADIVSSDWDCMLEPPLCLQMLVADDIAEDEEVKPEE